MINRATRGLYPPGSTFKMVTGARRREAGVVDLKEKIAVRRHATSTSTRPIRCWKRSGHGACDFHAAIKQSCDCYFYEIVRRTGIDALAAMARKLGFGQIYDCGLADLKRGLVPDPDWKRGALRQGVGRRRDDPRRHRPGLRADDAAAAGRDDGAPRLAAA